MIYLSFVKTNFDYFFYIFSDDSLGYEYPFVLKVVQFGGSWCAWCPWHRFCRGCELPCTNEEFSFAASYIAIDWDPTALHLRYLAVQEKAFIEDPSVEASLKVKLNLLNNYNYIGCSTWIEWFLKSYYTKIEQ